jgi:receptor-interacting serine/threonine-protein kinase 5
LQKIHEKVESLEGGSEENNRLAECSLFVCNKWDLVPEDQRDETKKYVVKKLKECWPGANLDNQIVFMSTTNAIKAQQYGGVTKEFDDLLEKIKQIILKAINIRLYNHWL